MGDENNGRVNVQSPVAVQEAQAYVDALGREMQNGETRTCEEHRKATIFTIRQNVQSDRKIARLETRLDELPGVIIARLEESGHIGKKRSHVFTYGVPTGIASVLYVAAEIFKALVSPTKPNP